MNSITKISTIEAIAFILIAAINKLVLSDPKKLIESVGTSAWLNIIAISIVTIIFILIICKLYKNFVGKDILDVSEYLGGKTLKKIIGILYFILFIYIAIIVLRNFSDSLQKIFLPNTPLTYIMLFIVIGMILANKLGFSSIIKINTFIVFLSLISIIIIFIAPIAYFDISHLFPILGNGLSETLFSGLTNMCVFSGLTYLYFIMPFLSKPQEFKKIAVISVIISSIYLFLSIISLLGLFGHLITMEDMFSVLLISKIINLGTVFERVDTIFLLVWIFSILVHLSFILYFALYNYKTATNISNQNGMIYTVTGLIFALSLLPKNIVELNYLQNNMLKAIVIAFLFVLPFILFVLANLKYKRKNKVVKREVDFDI